MKVITRAEKLVTAADAHEIRAQLPDAVTAIRRERERSCGEDEEKYELTNWDITNHDCFLSRDCFFSRGAALECSHG